MYPTCTAKIISIFFVLVKWNCMILKYLYMYFVSVLDSNVFLTYSPFPVRLENPHVIESDQIMVGVARRGLGSNIELNSNYQTRWVTQGIPLG